MGGERGGRAWRHLLIPHSGLETPELAALHRYLDGKTRKRPSFSGRANKADRSGGRWDDARRSACGLVCFTHNLSNLLNLWMKGKKMATFPCRHNAPANARRWPKVCRGVLFQRQLSRTPRRHISSPRVCPCTCAWARWPGLRKRSTCSCRRKGCTNDQDRSLPLHNSCMCKPWSPPFNSHLSILMFFSHRNALAQYGYGRRKVKGGRQKGKTAAVQRKKQRRSLIYLFHSGRPLTLPIETR